MRRLVEFDGLGVGGRLVRDALLDQLQQHVHVFGAGVRGAQLQLVGVHCGQDEGLGPGVIAQQEVLEQTQSVLHFPCDMGFMEQSLVPAETLSNAVGSAWHLWRCGRCPAGGGGGRRSAPVGCVPPRGSPPSAETQQQAHRLVNVTSSCHLGKKTN